MVCFQCEGCFTSLLSALVACTLDCNENFPIDRIGLLCSSDGRKEDNRYLEFSSFFLQLNRKNDMKLSIVLLSLLYLAVALPTKEIFPGTHLFQTRSH